MALRCTVFGHRWGEADVKRDRHEDGDEVVVTVREVRTCGRCEAEDVLGESMEVTAIDRGDVDADGRTSGREPPADESVREDGEAYDAETDDGVILDDGEDDGGGERAHPEWPDRPERDDDPGDGGKPAPWPESARPDDEEPPEDRFVGPDETAEQDRGGEADEPGGADEVVDADGEIIEAGDDGAEDDGDGGHDRDERPADGRVDVPRSGAGTDRDRSDGHGDRGDDDDIDRSGDDDSDRSDDASASGAADGPAAMGPDATQHPDDDAEVLETTETNEQSRATASEPVDPEAAEDARADSSDGESRATPDDEPSRPDVSLDPSEPPADESAPEDVEHYCPECGYVDESDWPSRRAGDVCPDCRRSYLAERKA